MSRDFAGYNQAKYVPYAIYSIIVETAFYVSFFLFTTYVSFGVHQLLSSNVEENNRN